MIKMKALKSFGVAKANEGKVKRGREFTVASEARAATLERHGLAYRVVEAPKPAAGPAKGRRSHEEAGTGFDSGATGHELAGRRLNPAAEKGPLGSAGGETGEATPASSSPPAPAQRKSRLRRPAVDPDLLS